MVDGQRILRRGRRRTGLLKAETSHRPTDSRENLTKPTQATLIEPPRSDRVILEKPERKSASSDPNTQNKLKRKSTNSYSLMKANTQYRDKNIERLFYIVLQTFY